MKEVDYSCVSNHPDVTGKMSAASKSVRRDPGSFFGNSSDVIISVGNLAELDQSQSRCSICKLTFIAATGISITYVCRISIGSQN
jgi:hypothetical protein